MSYTPTEEMLIVHEFVLNERARIIAKLPVRSVTVKKVKKVVHKPLTKKQKKEMLSWGVKYVEN